jgi:3alpha(or 20beta)-hydroxysteroid dehydrogenase
MRLHDKIAIITGAARGMGEAEARLFAREGARVVVADVLDAEAKEVAASIGGSAHAVHLDVSDEASWWALLTETIDHFGTPDVLINNAGILRVAPLLETTNELLHEVLDVNLVGPMLGMKVVGQAMARAAGGSIVNVSSTGGMVGYSMIDAYVASKWGLRGVTKSAALELGRWGVRVNSIHPGAVATPMTGVSADVMEEPPPRGTVEEDQRYAAADERSAHQPIARAGRPIEIANLALFLASDESSYCTGSEFVADGGATAGQDLSGDL